MGVIIRSLTNPTLLVSDEKRPYLCCASPKIQREGGLLAPKLEYLAAPEQRGRCLQLCCIIIVAQCAMCMQRRIGGFCERQGNGSDEVVSSKPIGARANHWQSKGLNGQRLLTGTP